MRNDIDINFFKKSLEDELVVVERELNGIGHKNPDNKNDWEAESETDEVDSADSNEVADKFEDYEEHSAVIRELEIRRSDIKDALSKIEEGKYGMCEVSGDPIEEDRLIANPSARTCKQHMES
jgi:RNA polymerase-binding transcription factor DksA